MKRKISAKIIADSLSPQGRRITTFILQYPRFIHAEVMTHRMFSRNAASSRAIPFPKMLQSVKEDPFVPIAWQKDHSGMQGTEYLEGFAAKCAELAWRTAAKGAAMFAEQLHKINVTKQLANRLLEPFLWYTNLVTATEFENFYDLRCPQYPGGFKSKKGLIISECRRAGKELLTAQKLSNMTELDWIKMSKSHAEIHIQALAEAMWDAHKESTPEQLKAGEWHIPFGDQMDVCKFDEKLMNDQSVTQEEREKLIDNIFIKVATARCARLSYMTFDGEIDYEKDIELHDRLLERKHASCFEHCAKAMSDDEYKTHINGVAELCDDGESIAGFMNTSYGWCRNLRGFIPYRHLVKL